MPCYRRAPIVAGNDRLLGSQRIQQPDHVADQMQQRVPVDLRRLVGPPVAAQVGCDRTEPGCGEGRQLMAPRIPNLGKAVAQQDQRAFALLRDMHADAVGIDGAMPQLGHRGQTGVSPFSIRR